MPHPGSIPHLDWLNRLEPDIEQDPSLFLQETAAVTTIARLIRRHRTFWPMEQALQSSSIALDSTKMNLGEAWSKDRFFSARLEIYGVANPAAKLLRSADIKKPKELDESNQMFKDPRQHSSNILIIEGRPFPGSNVHNDIVYNLKIPVTRALLHDVHRPVLARTESTSPGQLAEFFGAQPKKPDVKLYNPIAFEEYGENDKGAFYKAFGLAMSDLQLLVHNQMRNWNSVSSLPRKIEKGRLKTLGSLTMPFRKAA